MNLESRTALLSFVLVACGGEAPQARSPSQKPDSEIAAGDAGAAADAGAQVADVGAPTGPTRPFISRFAPHQGVAGTEVRILGDFSEDLSQCLVTIGGALAPVLDNPHVLTVVVPPDAITGPLCVYVGRLMDCAETFTVLTGPLVHFISPERVTVGAGDTALTVHGDGFGRATEVRIDGAALAATFASSSRLDAVVPARYLAAAGTRSITVFTPSPSGGSETGAVSLSVENPGPGLTRLEPSIVPFGDAPVLTLTGRGFVASSVVTLDGVEVPTTVVSSTMLEARMPASTSTGTHAVQVGNPPPGGGWSAPMSLTVE